MEIKDNPFVKNLEMWQELNSTYMENAFNLFEKNLAESQTIQDQMQAGIRKAVDSQFEAFTTSLKSMENQMAEMSKMMQDWMAAQQK